MASPPLRSAAGIDELHTDRAVDNSFESACALDEVRESDESVGFGNAGARSAQDARMENGHGQHEHEEEASLGESDCDHELTAWTELNAASMSAEGAMDDDDAEGEVQSVVSSAAATPSVSKTSMNTRRKSFGGIGSNKVISPPEILRTAKPSISSKLASAPRNKHVTPCSLDPNHSHSHRSPPAPVVVHRNFLKSSSPAAMTRKHGSEHGDDDFHSSSANSVNRRHSLGASATNLSSTFHTPTNRRASLDSKVAPASKLTKSASPRSDSRRAALSGPIPSKPMSESSKSPRGSFSPRSATPDSARKRTSPTTSTRSSSRPASPRTPGTSFSSPRANSSPSNGLSATPSGRKKAIPIFTQNIKSASSSVDSLGSRQSPKFASATSKRSASPSSAERTASNALRRKSSTSDTRDARFISLPSVDMKAGDDVRLDLRGQKIRSLDCDLVNLTPKMEFVYLRDNKLATLDGIEILRRVKVLDLSFNEFEGPDFEPLANCKHLQQLYLAGNQILSLGGLPQLPNLEFLSVAQNKLKSLTMAPQPRLQVLAASKNKISTFEGFPHLPMLEHLRLEENPISEMQHVEAAAILLAGPTLKKFNDKDLPREEQELARMYPAHTALCIRDGWEFCDVQEAFDSSMKFITAQWAEKLPPGYIVEQASIKQPSEEDPCSCHFTFNKQTVEPDDQILALHYQWFIGGRTAFNFIPIPGETGEVYWPKHEDVGRCLKVECTPLVGETDYPPIFAVSLPVLPGSGCPKVTSLSIEGEMTEGSKVKGCAEVAWCGGTPSKGIVSWLRRYENGSPVVIVGAEELEYTLSVDDVGSNLLLMYTPVTQEGGKGEPHFATSVVVQAAAPSVGNVQILGDVEEHSTITGVGTYCGGHEGSSKFEWLCEDIESGEFKLVASGALEYTLSQDDVGLRIMFIYTPVSVEGIRGDPVSAISRKVKLAPPKVTQLRIIGDLCEGSKIAISAIVSGGEEGASRVQWFKTNIPDETLGDANLEAISTAKVSKAFRIPVAAVGFYLAAKYTPVRTDGESGETVLIISDAPVEMLPPSLSFISITGDYVEGEVLTASYGYVGGNEGSSQYTWFLHKNERGPGMQLSESTGLLQYKITKEAANQLVSFKCTPVRADGVVGEAGTVFGQEKIQPGSPKLLSLKIVGNHTEGAEMTVEKTYWGGNEGSSRIQWFRASPDGTQREVKGAIGETYTCRAEDLDSFLCVSYEPVRSDGARGPIIVSEAIGPVLPDLPACLSLVLEGEATEGKTLSFIACYKGGEEGICTHIWIRLGADGSETTLSSEENLTLTLEDVGCQIKLLYTPVRKDGVTGPSQIEISDTVVDADPVCLSLVIPECCEDTEVIPKKKYFGGMEGDSDFTWFRLHTKLEDFNVPDDAKILGYFNTYTPMLEDVGAYLAVRWIPTRLDGKEGRPCHACSSTSVKAAPPSVSNVRIKEAPSGTFIGEGDYYGGFEGESQMSWFRQKDDGSTTLITGTNSNSYSITNDDYTCSLIFRYTPVRQDGVAGKLVMSDPTNILLPEIPRIQKLVLTGKAVEGEVLTALEVMPKSEKQQHVWENYKNEVVYHWSRSTAVGSMDSFETLPSQRGCSYRIRTEDIGHCICCECIVSDVFERSSNPVSVLSAFIAPGIPKITKLEIEGQGYHTNTYTVRGFYSGGKEGQSTIQWFRAMAGSPDLIPIAGEVGRTYEANVDDVGYRLVAVYTPVREDGTEGAPVSSSTEPIAVDPEIAKEVKQKNELGLVKFEALRDRDRSPLKVAAQQGLGNLERRVLDVNRKRVKVIKPGSKTSFPSTEIRGTYVPPFHVNTLL